jgi:hypothetical protein
MRGHLYSWKALTADLYLFESPEEAEEMATDLSVVFNTPCAVFELEKPVSSARAIDQLPLNGTRH